MKDKQTAGKYKGQLLTARHGSGKKKPGLTACFVSYTRVELLHIYL
jgi:hypothetical protein